MTRTRAHLFQQYISIFWHSVDIKRPSPDDPDPCWLWLGYQEDGYGRYFDGLRMRGAHELALEWTTGEVRGAGFETCHNCNTPLCCNPSHLRFDTRSSNVRDMVRAGTHKSGRKLSDLDVVAIRHRADNGASGRRLAADFGVSESLITEIIRGNRYPHLAGPIRTTHGNRKRASDGR